MNTLRNELKRSYSQIPNELITDLTLCHGSLRVLLYLFTKPDNWNVYNKDICKQLGISEQTLTKYWKILLASKWLRREVSMSKDGKLTGGYTYSIGNFTVSIHSTETVNSIDHSNTKPLNKQVTNRGNEYDLFLDNLMKHVKYKSKVTQTKEGRKLFKQFKGIDAINALRDDYVAYQNLKGEFAIRITDFMKDYEVYKTKPMQLQSAGTSSPEALAIQQRIIENMKR